MEVCPPRSHTCQIGDKECMDQVADDVTTRRIRVVHLKFYVLVLQDLDIKTYGGDGLNVLFRVVLQPI
jgi:hypothetical protein